MQTQEKPTTAISRRRKLVGLLVAAAAFAVVLIVGIALVLLSSRGDEAPPATTPSTTTTLAPTTTQAPPTTEAPTTTQVEPDVNAQQQATVDTFFSALNAGDVDSLLALFSPEALTGDGGPPGDDQVNVIQPDERSAFFSWVILSLPTVYEVDSCEFVDATVSCRVRYSNDLLTAGLGRPGSQSHVFDIEEGVITRYFITYTAIEANVAYEPFFNWLEANHPEAVSIIWDVGCCGPEPILTEESANLHRQLAEEYVATLDG